MGKNIKTNIILRWGMLLSPIFLTIYTWIAFLPNEIFLERDVLSFSIEVFESKYYYLGINLFTIFFPFILSFDKKVAFYKNWKPLSLAILIIAAIFIIWDVYFTTNNVWNFNPKYLCGIYLLNLPIEEWLFFFTVPYACIFIYECLKAYLSKIPFKKSQDFIFYFFILFFFLIGILNFHKVYFGGTCLLTASFLFYQLYYSKRVLKSWLILTYIISWFPFMLVDGMLTGLFSVEPIVLYNPEEFSGLRILSVPIDDSIYSLLLISMNLELFEKFKKKFVRIG